MTTKKQIFLSYGRGDDQALVEEIATKINNETVETGFSAWYDKFNLPSATQFTDEIAKAIEDSHYLVLFIGEHSLKSEWCEREWKHALKQCVPIIPILVHVEWDDKRVKALPKQINRKNGTIANSMTVDDLVDWIIKQSGYDYTITQPLGIGTFPKHFVERPQYTDAIKTQLRVGDPTDISEKNVVGITAQSEVGALRGMSGIGKSTLAKAVCYDCEVQMTYDHIFFLEVNQSHKVIENELEATAMSLFRSLGFWLGDETEKIEAYKQLQTARGRVQDLLRGKRALIVLDDVWRKDIINLFTWEKVHLLITTRNRELIPSAHLVNTLTLEEGEQLFRLLFVISERVPTDITDDHRAILTFLDGHTLAIEIAGRWLIKYHTKKSPADYLAMLQSSEAELFKHLDMRDSDIDRNDKLERSIALSYTMLASDDDRARFRALGMFAPNTTFSLKALNMLWDLPDGFLEATTLTEVGLLEYDDKTERYSQHPLLRAYALKLLHNAGEHEVIFGRYADFYIQRAEDIFVKLQNNPELWGDQKGGENFDDVVNITFIGNQLMLINETKDINDLYRFLEFLYKLTDYVINRMEVKGWVWFEKGLVAINNLRDMNADNKILQAFEATFLNNLGIMYRILGDTKKALSYFQQALPIYRSLSEKWGEATTLNNIGIIYSGFGDKNEALRCFEMALSLQISAENKKGEATTLNNIGTIYTDLGDYDGALKCFNQALFLNEAIQDKLQEAITLSNIGTIYNYKNDIKQAIIYFRKSLLLQKLTGDKNGEIITLNNLGNLYLELRDTNNALHYFEEALSLNVIIDNKFGQAYLLHNIGALYNSLSDSKLALDYYEKALSIMKMIGDNSGEALVLRNIAVTYHNKGDLDKAIEYHELSIQTTFIGDSRLHIWQEELIMLRSKRGYVNASSEIEEKTSQPQRSEFATLIAKLADIYKQTDEATLRDILKQSKFADVQIDEIVTAVISQIVDEE